MENFADLIKERRSIRRFKDQPIDKDLERELLESVMWSQSWANTQCWEIIIVKDKSKREALQSAFFGKNPAVKTIVSAPALFVFCGKKEVSGYYNNEAPTSIGDWLLYDLGIATQNFCLFAKSKGLGSVVTGLFDHEKASEILGIPDNVQLVSLVPVGYPDHNPKPPKRKEIETFTHVDEFGNMYK